LLYALLAAYIAGGTDITQHWLSALLHVALPKWLSAVIFTVVLGYVVYRGIRWVDLVNRGLLSAKLFFCLALIVLLVPFVMQDNLLHNHIHRVLGATTVVITSFGFATIVPSLRAYFNSDVRKLRLAIVVGSLIPLVFYIAWCAVVQGILPLEGNNGLAAMQASGNVTVQLSSSLTNMTHNIWITWFANLFTSICVFTSFLGVALCLTDFLADGFVVMNKEKVAFRITLGTLLPPLLLVLFIPALFIKALSYAGICCIILLIMLPAMMAYSGRYVKKITADYQVFGGKLLLIALMIFSVLAIVLDFVGL
jgi:tyrosine-specific transport protein